MPCECQIAALFDTGGVSGIISADISGSQELIDIISNCDQAPNTFEEVRKRLKGPSTGSLNITAFAFPQGASDRFLGVTCPSSASMSFPTQTRFDCEANVTRIIRTKTGEASREGDPLDGVTLLGDICSFRTVNVSAQGGPFSPAVDTEKFIGTDLVWEGLPFPFDSRDPDTLDLNLFGLDVKLTNFQVSSQPPSVATTTYSFEFSIPSCEGELPI